MSYKRITEDEFQIHGNYGNGFEEVTCATTLKEAKSLLKDYRENESGTPFKMIVKRIKIDENEE